MAERVRCEHSEQVSLWMSLALDGMLDADHGQRLEKHLVLCPGCQVQWQTMQHISTVLADAPMAGPPLGFAVRVERRLAERARKRRQWFGGAAVLTSSLSLAGITVATVLLLVLGLLAWSQLGSQTSVQQGSTMVLRIASGLGVIGKVVSPFLKDLLLHYGLPLLLLVVLGLVLLSGLWAWLFCKQSRRSHRNGYA